ncbi:hypothetical protein JZ751_006214 [Albula glossodonta]|uniref:LITAF domain-containing protein n=1 Tax=Albula glossodonta TaxID=121402 RepID=A0A8T2N8K5_9TELE|nr:hypothetical protein JZ751_006214 [Albula glossodonta]
MSGTSEIPVLENVLEELYVLGRRQLRLEERSAILMKQYEFMRKANKGPYSPKFFINKDMFRAAWMGAVQSDQWMLFFLQDVEKPSELAKIEKELVTLEKRKEEQLQRKNSIIIQKSLQTDDHRPPTHNLPPPPVYDLPCANKNIYSNTAPPSTPAPEVITDVENLPPFSSKTQCPSCEGYVSTEIFYRVGSATWLLCFVATILGCVAGCCVIPFCFEGTKDIGHRCPKCQKEIHVIQRL